MKLGGIEGGGRGGGVAVDRSKSELEAALMTEMLGTLARTRSSAPAASRPVSAPQRSSSSSGSTTSDQGKRL